MPSHEKPKLSDDFSESETLSSILNYEANTPHSATARWHPEEGKQRSEDIDRYLEAESVKLQQQIKALVLGSLEPKDVFWKRSYLLENPLSSQDRDNMRPVIRQNILGIARQVADEMLSEIGKLDPLNHNDGIAANRLREILEYEGQEFGQRITDLCSDGDFQALLASKDLKVDNVAIRLLTSRYPMYRYCSCADQSTPLTTLLRRVVATDYTPTDHDYIHFDNRRTHSYLREAQLHRDTHLLRVLDLHSGRGERKKWIHLFEDMRCVVFVTDLASYVSHEEELDYSPLRESLVLFESVARSRWFRDTPMVCVLCNVGVFKGLLKDQPLQRWFPSCKAQTGDEAVHFLTDLLFDAAGGRLIVEIFDELDGHAVKNVSETIERQSLKKVLGELGDTSGKTG